MSVVAFDQTVHWLLSSDEPWTRYRTQVDLLGLPDGVAEVRTARAAMLAHPQVRGLVEQAAQWPGYALKRHNDAAHPLYALSTLVDFGLRADDPGMAEILDAVLAHQSNEGAFQTKLRLYKQFGGLEGEWMTWMACDAPTLLYVLLAMGMVDDPRVQKALDHLVSQVQDNGWRCAAAPELGNFKGPGKREDPCPIANVYALKALSQVPKLLESPVARRGSEMLLGHWVQQGGRKLYLFGIGTDFRKLKYPFVWYDVLHVADVLSRFPGVHEDQRFLRMVHTIWHQADGHGRFTAGSMYRAWSGWSFADKKEPSPWLTLLALRIRRRIDRLESLTWPA